MIPNTPSGDSETSQAWTNWLIFEVSFPEGMYYSLLQTCCVMLRRTTLSEKIVTNPLSYWQIESKDPSLSPPSTTKKLCDKGQQNVSPPPTKTIFFLHLWLQQAPCWNYKVTDLESLRRCRREENVRKRQGEFKVSLLLFHLIWLFFSGPLISLRGVYARAMTSGWLEAF